MCVICLNYKTIFSRLSQNNFINNQPHLYSREVCGQGVAVDLLEVVGNLTEARPAGRVGEEETVGAKRLGVGQPVVGRLKLGQIIDTVGSKQNILKKKCFTKFYNTDSF